MENEKLLPKPLTDLPLPEKEIPARATPQGQALQNQKPNTLRSKFFLGFVAFSILIAFLIGGFMLGRNSVFKELNPTTPSIPPAGPVIYDPTADWKTYEGDGFTFKYPLVNKVKKDSNGIISLDLSNNTIRISEEASNLTLDKYVDQKTWCTDIASSKGAKISLSVESALRFNKTPCGQTGSTDIYSIHNGIAYHIQIDTQENYDIVEPIFNQILSTFKFTDSSSANFLEIPEYGVKIPLTQNIMDAYYLPDTTSKGYVYLKVHSLDKEPYCNDNSSLGVAALSRVSKDEIDQRTGKKFSDSGNGTLIGNYYYYIDLSQAVCSQKSSNLSTEVNARKEFDETSKNIEKL